MRQTAVEWLQDCLTVHFSEIEHQIKFTGLFEKAKRLENELKIEMFDKGFDSVQQLNDDYAIEFAEWLMDGHVSELTLKEIKKKKGL